MTTRTRSMVLDGHSVEADLHIDPATRAKVEVVVYDIVRVAGPITDDAIVTLYEGRAEAYPDVPKVTAQRVRTARAKLVRDGRLMAHPVAGASALGNPATRWDLADPAARRARPARVTMEAELW